MAQQAYPGASGRGPAALGRHERLAWLLALGVLTEAQSQGIAVPERLAIVGFGDLEFAADLHPALTTEQLPAVAFT